ACVFAGRGQVSALRSQGAVRVGRPWAASPTPSVRARIAAGRRRASKIRRPAKSSTRRRWDRVSDLSAIVTNNPPAFPSMTGSPLAAVVTPDGIPRIFYVGQGDDIHEIRLEQPRWAQ